MTTRATQRALRQRSEQNFTCSHTFSHFFRQANGRPQAGHTFVGRWGLVGRFGFTGSVS